MRIPVGKDDSSFFTNSLLAAFALALVVFAGHALMKSSKTHMTFVPTQVAANK